MTETELDFLIADKVMGWAPHKRNTVHWTLKEKSNDIEYPIFSHTDVWSPTRKIEDAWMVVEKMDEIGWPCQLANNTVGKERFSAHFWLNKEFKSVTAFSETMPKSICLATLKAVGVEVSE